MVSGTGACETRIAASGILGSEHVLLRIQNINLVSKGAQYHKRCYLKYCIVLQLDKENSPNTENSCDRVFQKLVSRLESDLFQNSKVLTMKEIATTHLEMVYDEGFPEPSVRTDRLRKKLALKIGERITFWQPKWKAKSILVFSNNIKRGGGGNW